MGSGGRAPGRILPEIREALNRPAGIKVEIAGPFVCATVTREGFSLIK